MIASPALAAAQFKGLVSRLRGNDRLVTRICASYYFKQYFWDTKLEGIAKLYLQP
jgi:hypothetical protein